MRSVVRVYPGPPAFTRLDGLRLGEPDHDADIRVSRYRGCSSVGRAVALQASGRRFDPVQLHHSLLIGEGRETSKTAVETKVCTDARRVLRQCLISSHRKEKIRPDTVIRRYAAEVRHTTVICSRSLTARDWFDLVKLVFPGRVGVESRRGRNVV